jgi:hypothetical protein
MVTINANDPVLQMASRLMAAVITRPDTAVYDANWTEARRGPIVATMVALAREVYDEVARTQVAVPKGQAGSGTWTVEEKD